VSARLKSARTCRSEQFCCEIFDLPSPLAYRGKQMTALRQGARRLSSLQKNSRPTLRGLNSRGSDHQPGSRVLLEDLFGRNLRRLIRTNVGVRRENLRSNRAGDGRAGSIGSECADRFTRYSPSHCMPLTRAAGLFFSSARTHGQKMALTDDCVANKTMLNGVASCCLGRGSEIIFHAAAYSMCR